MQDDTNPTHNDGPRFDIETSPPFDGTLDLQLGMYVGVESDPAGVHPILKDLVALPSGLKFRTLKLTWCTGDDIQPLIDACAPSLECMEFTGQWSGSSFPRGGDCPKLIGFDNQALPPVLGSVSNNTLHSDNLESNQMWVQKQRVLPDGYLKRSRPLPQMCSPS